MDAHHFEATRLIWPFKKGKIRVFLDNWKVAFIWIGGRYLSRNLLKTNRFLKINRPTSVFSRETLVLAIAAVWLRLINGGARDTNRPTGRHKLNYRLGWPLLAFISLKINSDVIPSGRTLAENNGNASGAFVLSGDERSTFRVNREYRDREGLRIASNFGTNVGQLLFVMEIESGCDNVAAANHKSATFKQKVVYGWPVLDAIEQNT